MLRFSFQVLSEMQGLFCVVNEGGWDLIIRDIKGRIYQDWENSWYFEKIYTPKSKWSDYEIIFERQLRNKSQGTYIPSSLDFL